MRLNYTAYEDYNWMSISTESVSKLKNTHTSDRPPFSINFTLTKDGLYNISLFIHGENSLITNKYIMPGNNIRTFLNSYEDDLYEKIISLSDYTEEYCIGPYYFQFLKESGDEGSSISIGKRDERSGKLITIGFDNEIVTWISRNYNGTVSGFEDKPLLW